MDQHAGRRNALLCVAGVSALLLVAQSFFVAARWIHQPFAGFFVHENLTVGPYFLPSWSGPESGLKPLDQIVAIDGKANVDRQQFHELVRQKPPGSGIRYHVNRGTERLDIVVPTQIFALGDWLWSFGSYTVIALTFLLVGSAPFYFRATSPVAAPLSLMSVTVFVWFQTTFDYITDGMLPKELRILALSLTPAAAVHMALGLTAGAAGAAGRATAVALVYAGAVALGILHSATFFASWETWIAVFRASYIYVLAGAAAFLGLTAAAVRRSDSALDRSRLRVIFVGGLMGFLLPALVALLATTTDFQLGYNLALVPTASFPIAVAYALLKYRLFDLGNALKLGLSRVSLWVLLVLLYAVTAMALGPALGDYGNERLVPIFFSILVVAVFNPLLRRLEAAVDRYIFRQDYNPAVVQQDVSLFLRNLGSPKALAEGFLERISTRLGIAGAQVLYQPKDSSAAILVSQEPPDGAGVTSKPFEAGSLKEIWPTADFRGVARAEVKSHPLYAGNREKVLNLFISRQAELMFPLVYEREVRGAVALGAKRSTAEYSAEDFRLLAVLADQLALALENGRLYESSVAAYQRVELANQKLREADRIKKDFVANICHELRTPVSTVIGYGEVLREFELPARAKEFLSRMIENGRELCGLMDTLMNFSRMEADRPTMHVEQVKIRDLVSGLEMMTRRLIRQRPIEFAFRIDAAIETLQTDGQKLQQILAQLLTNAAKFTARGKIELSVRSGTNFPDPMVEFAVSDTGIGIKPEDRELIFEDFRQLDGSSTRHYGGTGVGLGLCRKLAEALGGEIHVEGQLGAGSVFRLYLPARISGLRGEPFAAAPQEISFAV